MNKILLLMLIYIKLNSQLYLNYNTSNDFNDENDYIYQGTRLIIYEDIS